MNPGPSHEELQKTTGPPVANRSLLSAVQRDNSPGLLTRRRRRWRDPPDRGCSALGIIPGSWWHEVMGSRDVAAQSTTRCYRGGSWSWQVQRDELIWLAGYPRSGGPRQIKSPARKGRVRVQRNDMVHARRRRAYFCLV